MEILLNRWRGTGVVFWEITGTMLYALYVGLLVVVLSEWYYGLGAVVLFLVGESFAFGKWVGFLVDYEDEHTPEYGSKVGKSFPYIHYIANAVVKEVDNYKRYCQVALVVRGFIWWTPLLVMLGSIGLLGWYEVAVSSAVLAVGFPVACAVGREWKLEYESKYLKLGRGWENQEIAYGAIQFVCLTLMLLVHKLC